MISSEPEPLRDQTILRKKTAKSLDQNEDDSMVDIREELDEVDHLSDKVNKVLKKNNLSTVEEMTESSDDNYDDSEYQSRINFEELSGGVNLMPDYSENEYCRIKDFRRNYLVHYISTGGKDLELAIEYLLNHKYLGVHTEILRKRATYIEFSAKRRGFVFNLHNLRGNSKFERFLAKVFSLKSCSKICYNAFETLASIKDLLCKTELNNVVGIQNSLYISDTPKAFNLSENCLRLFGKRIDTEFRLWVSESKNIGLDDIHYAVLNSLSVLMIYLQLKNILRAEVLEKFKKTDNTRLTVFLDTMCVDIQETLQSIGVQSITASGLSYERRNFDMTFRDHQEM